MEPTFERIFGGKSAMRLWFADLILYSTARHAMFELPADGVKHHKPSPQAYAYFEKELGAKPSDVCLIACHTWDTLGAVAAGWEAALIKRVGNDVLGVGPQPHIVGNDLNDVADQLIARHKARA
jgi:2-haloacid dehalogenase